ncbi:MAG: LysM peptidoglycan-binding domain-containing protein [Lentisphaeria bacterium]|nr:LysM peptidoglycan-binding domain-containing protein [Lentisphaeria bacterium]
MKIEKITAAVVSALVLPVLLCSCGTSGKEAAKAPEETAVPQQETAVQETPQPVEVKADAKTEAVLAEQEAKKTEAPAATVKEEEKPVPVPAAKEEKKSVPPCEHTVHTGDNLWKISRQYYGTGAQWKRIYEANREKIKKADLLEPGTVLSIPAFQ